MRLLKALSPRQLSRLPELFRCRAATRDWKRVTAAYLGLHNNFPFEIQLGAGRFRFETIADVRTFWPIFFSNTYGVHSDDRVIVDAGANIGAFSVYALLKAPQSKVIAIEPAPDSYQRLRQSIESSGLAARANTYQCALGSTRGTTTINMTAESQFRETGRGGVTVPLEPLTNFITETVDLLKMDIEGAEAGILLEEPEAAALHRVRRIAMEFHPGYSLDSLVARLAVLGFVATNIRHDGDGYGILWLSQTGTPA